jgi:GrpB-like predicted nucleotidyltransferase (UPF0157 family)
MMNDQIPVVIVDYNPIWVELFLKEKEKLVTAIGPFCASIEHIGSTAVPGLAAKPVIDILIGVHHLQDAPLFIPPLVELGYEYIPEHERELPERRYLHKIVGGLHTYHLHIVEPATRFYTVQLSFRDYLRSHAETAREYAELKKLLAARFTHDRSAYTEAKSGFIQEVLNKSMKEAAQVSPGASPSLLNGHIHEDHR